MNDVFGPVGVLIGADHPSKAIVADRGCYDERLYPCHPCVSLGVTTREIDDDVCIQHEIDITHEDAARL